MFRFPNKSHAISQLIDVYKAHVQNTPFLIYFIFKYSAVKWVLQNWWVLFVTLVLPDFLFVLFIHLTSWIRTRSNSILYLEQEIYDDHYNKQAKRFVHHQQGTDN